MFTRTTPHDTAIIELPNVLDSNPRLRMVRESASAYRAAQKAIENKGLWVVGLPLALIYAAFIMFSLAALLTSIHGFSQVFASLAFHHQTPSLPVLDWALWVTYGLIVLFALAAGVLQIVSVFVDARNDSALRKANQEFGVTRAYPLMLPADTQMPREDHSRLAYLAMERLTPEVRDRLYKLDRAGQFAVVQEALNMLMADGAEVHKAHAHDTHQADANKMLAERERVALAAIRAITPSDGPTA